jgi:hypothetical protein
LVTLTADEVRALIREAVAIALDDERRKAANDAQAMSVAQAAKIARVRRSTLTQALVSGAVVGRKTGTGRWLLLAADVAAWVRAGRPVEASA